MREHTITWKVEVQSPPNEETKQMREYTVTWEVDVDANSPEEAAIAAEAVQASQILRNGGACSGVFRIRHKADQEVIIDLERVYERRRR
jgi:hypothetical protein